VSFSGTEHDATTPTILFLMKFIQKFIFTIQISLYKISIEKKKQQSYQV